MALDKARNMPQVPVGERIGPISADAQLQQLHQKVVAALRLFIADQGTDAVEQGSTVCFAAIDAATDHAGRIETALQQRCHGQMQTGLLKGIVETHLEGLTRIQNDKTSWSKTGLHATLTHHAATGELKIHEYGLTGSLGDLTATAAHQLRTGLYMRDGSASAKPRQSDFSGKGARVDALRREFCEGLAHDFAPTGEVVPIADGRPDPLS